MTIYKYPKRNGEMRYRAQYRKRGISLSKIFLTRLEAKLWLEELDRIVLQDDHFLQADIKLDLVIDRYIREISSKRTKSAYRSERIRLLRLARSPIAEKYLRELDREALQQWQNQRLKEVSLATVIREKGTFSAVLSQAVRWELLAVNPMSKTDRLKAPKARNRRYSEQEINRIVEHSKYHSEKPITETRQRVGAAFLFAIETAMRAGEICGLTWRNVNFEKRTAFLPVTKNGHSRTVPLSTKAIQLLQHFATAEKQADNAIFGLKPTSLDANFRKIKLQAGLENADLHFHDTRREALSRLAQKFNVMELAKISGHREISILQNTYYSPDISEFARRLD